MFLDKCAISHKAGPIPLVIAFLKIFYQLAWIGWTFKTVGQSFLFYAVFYLAFSTMLRLSAIAVQTPCTWLFVITVFVTNHAVHSAWSEHRLLIFLLGIFIIYVLLQTHHFIFCFSLYHKSESVEIVSFPG